MSLENWGFIIILGIAITGCAYWQNKYFELFDTLHKIIHGGSKKQKFSYTIEDKKIILKPNFCLGYTLEIKNFRGEKL